MRDDAKKENSTSAGLKILHTESLWGAIRRKMEVKMGDHLSKNPKTDHLLPFNGGARFIQRFVRQDHSG